MSFLFLSSGNPHGLPSPGVPRKAEECDWLYWLKPHGVLYCLMPKVRAIPPVGLIPATAPGSSPRCGTIRAASLFEWRTLDTRCISPAGLLSWRTTIGLRPSTSGESAAIAEELDLPLRRLLHAVFAEGNSAFPRYLTSDHDWSMRHILTKQPCPEVLASVGRWGRRASYRSMHSWLTLPLQLRYAPGDNVLTQNENINW